MVPLEKRTLYIPQMSYEGAACMAAAFRSIGVQAEPSPDSDAKTYELARAYLSGDECLPEAVTLGNFLKVAERSDYDPDHTAFMLPTSNGPCRYGHYLPLAKKVFHQIRNEQVMFAAPTSSDGYGSIGDEAKNLVRTGWRAVVASDIVRKLLFSIRPYETKPGAADKAYDASLQLVCDALATPKISHKQRMQHILNALRNVKQLFAQVPVDRSQEKLLIGVVGEIFCRHNSFSNNNIVRLIEKYGGVVWISDIAEWVHYTSNEEELRLAREGKQFSFQMFGAKLRQTVMHRDEHVMVDVFQTEFKGMKEPDHVMQVLERARPYLPREGSNGEMVMSMGKTLWYHEKGAAGVIDISPFTCMNGIITEAVYPRVSRELGDFPIRVFYFDGLQTDIEGDLEIFMELARNYRKRRAG